MYAHRKLPPLSSILASNPFNILHGPLSPKGFHQTPDCSCKICKEATFTTTINNPQHPGRGFAIPRPINCLSSNLVYSLSCPCGLMYVGKTTHIKPRWSNHKSHIWNGLKTCNMASHCSISHMDSMVGKGKLSTSELVKSSFTFTLLESVGLSGTAEDLDRCEEIWRNRLNTWTPNGLNVREDGPQIMRRKKVTISQHQ